jgi:hypothetical protein
VEEERLNLYPLQHENSQEAKKIDSTNGGANRLAETKLKLDEDPKAATGSNPVLDK